MPLDVKCDGCGRRFRAPDKLAGKRVKCPQCQAVILVGGQGEDQPAPKPQARAGPKAPATQPKKKKMPVAKPVDEDEPAGEVKPPAAKDTPEWHVQIGDGEEYGPVTKAELDEWVAEGRLDGNCQLLKDGWDQWKWADDVYPQLAEGDAPQDPPAAAEPVNPFAAIGQGAPAGEVNPFVSPQEAAAPGPVGPAAGESAITPRIRRALADTKPWVMFLAILGFILGGLVALLLLLMVVISLMGGSLQGMLFSLMVGLGPALYLFAAYHLLTYGLRIGGFLRGGSVRELESAMVAQKSFWKLVGMVTAIVLVLYLVLVMLMFAMGVFAAAALRSGAGGM